MVNTRNTVRKEREMSKQAEASTSQPSTYQPNVQTAEVPENNTLIKKENIRKNLDSTSLLPEKCKKADGTPIEVPTSKKSESKKSSSSSIKARKAKLELLAAEAKAKIQMELIDKRLATDLADLEDEQSEPRDNYSHSTVNRWLEHSQEAMEKVQPANEHGNDLGELHHPGSVHPGTSHGTVQMLASALRDLAASSNNTTSNAKLLSRLSTPRDLPAFSGDPMEWLQFKQAYEESTEVCNFSSKENLWRIRKCLRGPARDAVAALLISATEPEKIMATLELRFGNPDGIVIKIMQDIKKLYPISQDYQKDIVAFSVKVQNFIEAIRSVKRDEYLQGMNIVSLILSKLPTVLLSKWSDYSFPLITEGKKSRLDILADFLQEEAVKISTTSNIHLIGNNFNRVHNTVLVTTDNHDFKCLYCRVSKHKLTECKRFKKSLRKDRWRHVKRHGICYKCLLSRHDRDTCPAAPCDIENCGQSHHRLLHYPITKDIRSPGNINITEITESATVTNINLSQCKVFLKTVPINIHGPNGVISATALLDDGSTVSLIDYELVKKLGLNGHKQTMRVSGAWNGSSLECVCEIVDLNVSNKDGTTFPIRVRSVKDLNLPVHDSTSIDLTNYEHSIPVIKNCLNNELCKPKLLIGQDNYDLLLPLQIIKLKNSNLYITRTELGLCIHGCLREASPLHQTPPIKRVLHSALFITNDSDEENESKLRNLEEQIRMSFTIESMGISMKPRQHPEDLQAIQYLENTSVLKNGRWHVGLPWKDKNCKMPNSYPNAAVRLKGIEKRLKTDKDYARRYTERINHLLENDYAEKLTCQEDTLKTWYLPHFGVDNPNKNKLRLVFDAAAKTCGVSLNDYLLKGPDLLMGLFGIMLRFRENKIGITGDIRDMYLRIKILPKDQDALRFLWRDNQEQNGPINTYTMTSLIFGANCSPFIAQFIKNKNAKQYESLYPAAVDAIHKQHYMDDYIDSIENEATAIKTIQDIIHIHKRGGFEIRNITSNNEAVLNCIPQETLGTTAVRFKIEQPNEGERTLGLIWYPKEDLLSFDVSFKKIPVDIITGDTRPSKRQMLKVLMSIFDIFGFLSPFTIKGKIMLQDVWRLQLDWDEKIPETIYEKWIEWLQLLKEINQLRIPRHYRTAARVNETEHCTSDPNAHTSPERPPLPVSCVSESVAPNEQITLCYTNLQLHIFCDASTKAMSAVAYWRWTVNDRYYVTFVASKCKVAPLKYMSIPRMELQAALLAVRLADTLCKELKHKPCKRYFWCDSSVVLHWIRNNTRNYTTFVAHRLGEIDELSKPNEWRYIPTKLNIADIATKETCDLSVLKNEWFYGPAFLRDRDTEWPVDTQLPEMPHLDLEYTMTMQTYNKPLPAVPDPERFSSWLRLLNATCNVLTFINKCKKLDTSFDGYTRAAAERWLIKYSQLQSFPGDIANLENKKEIDKKSRLLTLSPFLNEHGILCVGGRINAATDVPLHLKQPVILDGRHHVARLIVRYYHVRAAHGYNEAVVNELKQKYWILKLRPTVRSVASQCMFCRIRKAQPCPSRMGDLPAARMASRCRPFTHCGIDLFGPMEITVIRRREKRYGVLFTCLTVRAIHIELVPSLSTDSLIMALRRMAARRGWPQFIYSDNGTNLRGADNELKKATLDLDENILKAEAVNYGTTWTFIPPASPHWGGAWERLIRSVKDSLKIILRERAPREETLITLMAEVEQIVNSRPLTHVTVEPNSNETITPNHFLLGSSSNLPIVGAFDDSDLYLRKQWRLTQRLADMFWRRWVREVLPTMLPRQKWNRDTEPLRVGDLVLIADPESPRNTWPKGIIHRIIPGRDGRVRVVEVKTKTRLLRRSAARVAKVPTEVEC